MLVHHFNTYAEGGAATAARRLHRELYGIGIQGNLYCSDRVDTAASQLLDGEFSRPESILPLHWATPWRSQISFRLHRQAFKAALRKRPEGLEFFTSPRGMAQTKWPPKPLGKSRSGVYSSRYAEPDIFHLHWISRFIDYESFFRSLPPDKPIVWTLHDMNAFTGGCHFSSGCQAFRTGCGNCPQLGKRGNEDFSRKGFVLKQRVMQGLNLHIATPSKWMLELAKSSPILATAKSFNHIPYGISPTRFRPIDKQTARSILGLNADAFIISMGAMSIENRRKGTLEALKALSQLTDLPQLQIIIFGAGSLPEFSGTLPKIRSIGTIRDQTQRVAAYSASDLLMLPSLEDNLPLTGLEALACGAPIIGFAAGGIPDYVRQNQTGRLVAIGDSKALADETRELIGNPHLLAEMSRTSRMMILEEYSGEREAKAYSQLYAALCNRD